MGVATSASLLPEVGSVRMAQEKMRALVAFALGALAICAVFAVLDETDSTETGLVSAEHVHTVVERSCYMRECTSVNGKETCHTSRRGCHPTPRSHSSFMPRFEEHVVPRDFADTDFDWARPESRDDDVWRMPRMRMPRMRNWMPRMRMPWDSDNSESEDEGKYFPEFAGADKIAVSKSHHAKKHHALKVIGGPAAGLSKKQLKAAKKKAAKAAKAIKAYRNRIMKARKAYLKKVKQARKGLKLPKARGNGPLVVRPVARGRPAGPVVSPGAKGCFEKQCVSHGGRLQCKTKRFNCAGGNNPFVKAMKRMFHGPMGRAPGGRRPMVHVIRIRPVRMKKLTPKQKKLLKAKLKKVFTPKNIAKLKKALKKAVVKAKGALVKRAKKIAKAVKKARKKARKGKKARRRHSRKARKGKKPHFDEDELAEEEEKEAAAAFPVPDF